MRIGIDIDETLTNTEKSFYEVIKKYNIDFKKTYKQYWTEEEFESLSEYLSEILGNAKLKDGAKDVIDKLNEMGHELYIITARSHKYFDITTDMINENKLYFKDKYFNQNKKSDIAKKLNIDLMIDDSKFVYNNMKQEEIDCILFGDNIKTWNEVLKYINEKEEKNG